MSIDRRPARASSFLSLLVALGVTAAVGEASPLALLAAATGVVTLAAGLLASSRSWLTVGAFGLFAGVGVASLLGDGTALVLVAAAGTLVAWDLAEHAVGLGEQLGRMAATTRAELAHAALSVGVGAVAVGVALLAGAGGGSLPVSGLIAALLAAVVLFAALQGL